MIPGSRPHYAPDLPFRLETILLDVVVDPRGKTLQGTVTQKFKTVTPRQQWLKLDQIGLTIEDVKVAGRGMSFHTEGHQLFIRLAESEAQSPKTGEIIEVAIKYKVSHPRRGIYFTSPDTDYPNKKFQVWTQGQDEDSRYWFPTLDYPNQKAMTEVIATVPKGFTAISNGALIEKKAVGENNRFHYKLGTPHVTYLITLVVGEFVEISEKGPRDLPVQYFIEPGREEDGKRAFGNTSKMIEAFEKKIGVNYPYEKYSQAAVQDFIFGGMENTSATTQTELTLHDKRAHLDFTSDHLVSHELAHQWFGDLLTCRDWSNGWLNEGFATFMERVWIECKPGPDGGMDEAKYYSFLDFKEYLDEDKNRYRRPIVCNTYIEPIDLFDRHLYNKGGLVLNLIRSLLGEDAFWSSIKNYVTRHRGQNVETLDLIRAIEETTGRNFRRFFDEWVYGAGHPELELTYSWHEDKKTAEITIEQKQTGGAPTVTKDEVITHQFHLPVKIELTFEDGSKETREIEIGESRDRVFIQVSSKPTLVRFDPGFTIPKEMKFPRPKEMLLFQLRQDPDCMGRIEAAKELVKIADLEIISALGKTVASDSFWGVQAEAASALSEIRMDAARDALIGALSVKHPKARRAIVAALGTFKDPKAAEALKKFAEKDESYFVEAEGIHAWAMARSTSLRSSELDETEKFILSQLNKPSYRELIRGAALRALSELPGVSRGERPKAMSTLVEYTKRGQPLDARLAAISALGQVARFAIPSERHRILEQFRFLSDEDNFRIRMALVGALGGSESPSAIGILDMIRSIELDGRVKRDAQSAIDSLMTATTTPESVSNLKSSLEKLEEEYKKLKSSFEEFRASKH